MAARNVHVVDAPTPGTPVEDVYADNLPEAGEAYELPEATTGAIGGVRKAGATAAVSAADAAQAATETVTKAEFDAVVALANANKAAVNDLISKAQAAGQKE